MLTLASERKSASFCSFQKFFLLLLTWLWVGNTDKELFPNYYPPASNNNSSNTSNGKQERKCSRHRLHPFWPLESKLTPNLSSAPGTKTIKTTKLATTYRYHSSHRFSTPGQLLQQKSIVRLETI